MEKIYFRKTLIAIRIKKIPNGSIPVTEPSQFLQMVTLKHPRGTYLKAHKHIPRQRITQRLQECLVVKKGKIKIDLYSPNDKLFRQVFLGVGEALIMVNGGYGIHLLKNSEIFEIKNGPFIEDKILIDS
jgi:hypothetical protein